MIHKLTTHGQRERRSVSLGKDTRGTVLETQPVVPGCASPP